MATDKKFCSFRPLTAGRRIDQIISKEREYLGEDLLCVCVRRHAHTHVKRSLEGGVSLESVASVALVRNSHNYGILLSNVHFSERSQATFERGAV